MIKFSVKKPLTVFVCVVVVIVLGFVSVTKMTPTLMPNIDMPYVIVSTAYPGAAPEKVEDEISKPLERQLATLDDIKNVTSTSSENYSMVMLEFADDANMDTITVDILQKINLISGAWEDTVGTPTIMKINPNMMPVMVAAVDVDNMTTAELSRYVNDELIDKLEGVDGVVSINTSGVITQNVDISLDNDKIKALNKSVSASLNGTFDEQEDELDDGKAEIENGKSAIEKGKAELEEAQKEFAEKTANAGSELEQKEAELLEQKIELKKQIQALEEQLVTLKQQKTALDEVNENIKKLEQSKTSLEDAIDMLTKAKSSYEQLSVVITEYETKIAAVNADTTLTDEERNAKIAELNSSEAYVSAKTAVAQINAQLEVYGITVDQSDQMISTYKTSLEQVEAGLSAIDTSLAAQNIKRSDVANAVGELETGISQLETAKSQLETAQKQLENGQIKISEAKATLDEQKTNAILTFSSTSSNLISNGVSLNSAQSQIESGYNSFKEAKKSALKNADLTKTVTKDMISNILKAQNFSMPAGYATDDDTDYTVSVGDEYTSLDDIKNQLIVDLGLDDVEPIYLKDVADVKMVDDSEDVYAKVNNNNGIVLSFQKQSTAATATVSDSIEEKFQELSADNSDLHFTTLMDQGDYIYMITDSLFESLIFGAIFAVLILFLFLKDIKPTFITLCSIPVSILFALTLMYFSGISLNMMSLSGLAVAVGMLVDNSVVVIENIYRLKSKGVSAVKAAVTGASQVVGAIAASTLTTVCVFLPIVFVEGLTRELFSDMALTLGYSLVASLIIAITLVPSMASRMLKNNTQKEYKFLDKILAVYGKLLNKALGHRLLVLLAAVVILVASVGLSFMKGFSFMPDMETGQLSATLTMPEGTKLDETRKVSDKVIDEICKINAVDTVGAMTGSGMMSAGSSAESVTYYIILKEDADMTSKEVAAQINKNCKDLGGEMEANGGSSMSSMSMLTGSGITIKVYGDDLEELKSAATDISKRLEKIEGTKNVSSGIEDSTPSVKFVVNKNKAMKKGLTVAQVYSEISNALKTSVDSTDVMLDDNSYSVNITDGTDGNAELDKVKDLVIAVTDNQNNEKKVKLSDVTDMKTVASLDTINRENQKRMLTVSAEVDDNHNVTLLTSEAQKAMEDYKAPSGVTYDFEGENESIMDSMYDLLTMLLLGVLLVYLIMVAQFQSLKSPFIVMFTIPLAFTGGFLGLLVCGMELSVVAMIGMVMLTGIIVNNGIVLVDYINKLRISGMDKKQAIIIGGKTRLRPILMTSITTILGLIVMAIGIGNGTEMMQPVAVVCIGGLIYATLLTLFIVPIIYDLFNRKDIKVVDEKELEVIDE